MKARIESIEQKATRVGDPFWLLNLEGQRFSLFDAQIGPTLKQGDLIDFAWFENSQGFRKIRTVTKVEGGADLATAAPS